MKRYVYRPLAGCEPSSYPAEYRSRRYLYYRFRDRKLWRERIYRYHRICIVVVYYCEIRSEYYGFYPLSENLYPGCLSYHLRNCNNPFFKSGLDYRHPFGTRSIDLMFNVIIVVVLHKYLRIYASSISLEKQYSFSEILPSLMFIFLRKAGPSYTRV